ncbi:hypothetical protein ACFZAR_43830, partial [Streptomyces sp. NPDC008222]|uniref:hypothetical protein n=1 Tax=Streptomyces sp. NPDC008222 TaxID=3364820 RepID=UPI0036E4792B
PRGAGYRAASRAVVTAPLTLRQILAQARELNSASGILKASKFAQARIEGSRASADAWAGSKGEVHHVRACVGSGITSHHPRNEGDGSSD